VRCSISTPRSFVCAFLLGTAACAEPVLADQKSVDAGLDKIEHIVVIYGENRSFDNLYGLFPGANGIARAKNAPPQTDRDGSLLPTLPKIWGGLDQLGTIGEEKTAGLPNRPFRIDDPKGFDLPLSVATRDLVHRFYQNQMQINGGKMDRFAAWSDAGGLVMGYYDGSKLPMWKIAKQFTLADRFFMGAFGGSFLNHFWLACACTPVDTRVSKTNQSSFLVSEVASDGVSLVTAPDSKKSALDGPPKFAADKALTPDFYAVNTMQPAYQPSSVPPAQGGDPRFGDPKNPNTLPPQTTRTIGDTLTGAKVSWVWYSGAWTDTLSDRSLVYRAPASFQSHHQPFNYFARFAPGTADRAEHLKDYTDFAAAIDAGTLPQVAFYKPQGSWNEHPGYADVLAGDEHIAQIIAKIMASPLWKTTAIIVTYDENGGFWDHVAPPKGDRWGPGVRVPTIVVSPVARKGCVDHTHYDTTSIHKLINRRFGLAPLPGVRSSAGDLTNAFEFGGGNCAKTASVKKAK
jgi:phospholipase C